MLSFTHSLIQCHFTARPRHFLPAGPPTDEGTTTHHDGHVGRDCRCCVHSCMCMCMYTCVAACLSVCLGVCVLWVGILTLMCCVLSGMADCMDVWMDGRSTTPPTFSLTHSLALSLAFNVCSVPYVYAFVYVCMQGVDRVCIYLSMFAFKDRRTEFDQAQLDPGAAVGEGVACHFVVDIL